MLYIKVSIPIFLYKTFIYSYSKNPTDVFIGQGIKVLFNHRVTSGIIINIDTSTTYKNSINEILSLNQNSVPLSLELKLTLNWVSKYYICPIGKTLKSTIPYQMLDGGKNKIFQFIKITNLGLEQLKLIKFKNQKHVLKYLSTQDKFIKIENLNSITKAYKSTCKSLFNQNLILIKEKKYETPYSLKKIAKLNKLNKEQQKIYNDIIENINKKHKQYILSGIPGSGKTEIYIKLIKEIIKKKKNIIVLVPEISLIPQTYNKISSAFPGQTGYWHSKVIKKEKIETIKKIKNHEISIMVGARSCLFMPFNNLGLIIIDEEQEMSYKQTSNSPYFNARDVGIMRAKFSNSNILLCSASPSVETMYNKTKNNFKYFHLNKRYKNYKMPKIQIVDMTKEIHGAITSPIISNLLKNKIQKTLNKNQQIILLQNRRSFSYIIKCSSCDTIIQCPNCIVSLKYHKEQELLKCHHCNYSKKFTLYCNQCKNKSIKLFGVGTQKLELILNKLFPNIKVLRYDKDSISQKNNYQQILNQFEKGDGDILVGTQMIAKGLDFKNVSLVGVINADIGMSIPDFRSGEKTFQLLYQLIGRSGRHIENSEAVIQSYSVNDPYIQFACNNKLNQFYKHVNNERKTLFYPPFSKLIKILVMGKIKLEVKKEINQLKVKLLKISSIIILGPTSAPIEKLNNQFRMHIIIKANKNNWIDLYKNIISTIGLANLFRAKKGIAIKVDVDPISFL